MKTGTIVTLWVFAILGWVAYILTGCASRQRANSSVSAYLGGANDTIIGGPGDIKWEELPPHKIVLGTDWFTGCTLSYKDIHPSGLIHQNKWSTSPSITSGEFSSYEVVAAEFKAHYTNQYELIIDSCKITLRVGAFGVGQDQRESGFRIYEITGTIEHINDEVYRQGYFKVDEIKSP